MSNSNGVVINENIIKTLGIETAQAIRVKSAHMEAQIAAKIKQLESLVVEGFATDGVAKAKVDANHQVLELSFIESYPSWADQTKTCALMVEAVNDAIFKIDLTIEREISTIKYQVLSEVINETEKKDK